MMINRPTQMDDGHPEKNDCRETEKQTRRGQIDQETKQVCSDCPHARK